MYRKDKNRRSISTGYTIKEPEVIPPLEDTLRLPHKESLSASLAFHDQEPFLDTPRTRNHNQEPSWAFRFSRFL